MILGLVKVIGTGVVLTLCVEEVWLSLYVLLNLQVVMVISILELYSIHYNNVTTSSWLIACTLYHITIGLSSTLFLYLHIQYFSDNTQTHHIYCVAMMVVFKYAKSIVD